MSKQEFHPGIKTGQYTGDGQTSKAITGLGFQPKFVKIWTHATEDANAWVFEKTEDFATDRSVTHYTGYHLNRAGRLKSLDGDGFTVAGEANTNGQVYDYIAMG